MQRLAILPLLFILPACSLFGGGDPREGIEAQDDCIARFTASLGAQQRSQFASLEGEYVPTYTYDVTKMGLDEVKSLMVDGSDQTAGNRLTARTNVDTTAIAQFMAEPVDESGAFFLGRDPALYRVRGVAMPVDRMIASGCERQQANMRLIAMDWGKGAVGSGENAQSKTADMATVNETTN